MDPILNELDLNELDARGFDYTVSEEGDVVIDISTIDKTALIDLIVIINDSTSSFTIDESTITISAGYDMDGELEEEEDFEDEGAMDMALDDYEDSF